MYKYVSYISEQSSIMSESDLVALLNTSRVNNKRLGITGVLIYFNGIFTQYFEGAEEAVNELYSHISKDTRHRNIKELLSGHHPERYYSDWTMAYRSLNENEISSILGYQKLDKNTLFSNEKEVSHFGVNILKTFVDGLHIR